MNPLLVFMAILDLVAALSLMLIQYSFFPARFAYVCVVYLVFKGFLFFSDVASKIDLIIGLYLLCSAIFGFHSFVNYIMAIYLVQKAVLSFF
ncbi:MAG: hypothetical protein V1702_02900 [Candidatus Woesearchaeota archaeon]